MSLIIASQTIGFISFSITLLTLVGVYADLIKTLRSAPTMIPLALGNLREEIQYEQLYLNFKARAGDRYNVFPDNKPRKKRRSRHEFMSLLDQTVRQLWREFCGIEKLFLVKGETPWTLLRDGADGDLGFELLDEKGSLGGSGGHRRRSARQQPQPRRASYRKNRMGMIEAGLSSDRSTYYRTDLAARFLWWWKADDIRNLAEQCQRIQIRRIERDSFEMDEIIKRNFSMQCRTHGWNPEGDDDSDDSSDSDGGMDRPRRGGDGPRGGTSYRKHRRSKSGRERDLSPGVREVSEREFVRRRPRSSGKASAVETDHEVRRPPSRPRSVVYEYEVVHPGGVYIERGDRRIDNRARGNDVRSYSRDRD